MSFGYKESRGELLIDRKRATQKLRVICGWQNSDGCTPLIREGNQHSATSHGICPSCLEKLIGRSNAEELNQLSI